jgi:2-polyprenyl-3-methyl-5-hydroxy-6-metoxy-1,4-benzoquinol methylase
VGYVPEKYTKAYFLRRDEQGQPTAYGVIGLEEFEKGGIRRQDEALLAPLDFKGKAVLELGFGRGEAIKYALEHGATEVVGVDFSEDAVAIAKEFLREHGLVAEIICADALEFIKGRETQRGFDVVLMLDVLEHIPRSECASLLRQMLRILKLQAVLVINTPVFGADNDLLVEGLKPEARDESDDFPETSGMHCNRYTRASLRRFMRACGYRAIGGHYFVNGPARAALIPTARRAWRRACQEGYPLGSPVKPLERYDIAYSSRQQEHLRRWASNRLLKHLGPRLLPVLWRLGLKR